MIFVYIPQNYVYTMYVFSDKDVLRTDRDIDMFRDNNSHRYDIILITSCLSHDSHMTRCNHRLTQLEDILRTYVMYNFDLGMSQKCLINYI